MVCEARFFEVRNHLRNCKRRGLESVVAGTLLSHCWSAFHACSCCFCVEDLKAWRSACATSGPNFLSKVWRRKEARSMVQISTTEPCVSCLPLSGSGGRIGSGCPWPMSGVVFSLWLMPAGPTLVLASLETLGCVAIVGRGGWRAGRVAKANKCVTLLENQRAPTRLGQGWPNKVNVPHPLLIITG